jgi:hypothetical protein
MAKEPHVPNSSPSARAARELALRRWRRSAAPESPAETAPSPSPASVLALHRWRPAPESRPVVAAPGIGPDTDAWANAATLAILAGLAALIHSARRASGPPAMPESTAAGARPHDDGWGIWLLGGIAAITALLLLCFPAARRNWGLVAGLGCVALAAFGPLG